MEKYLDNVCTHTHTHTYTHVWTTNTQDFPYSQYHYQYSASIGVKGEDKVSYFLLLFSIMMCYSWVKEYS